MYTLYDKRTGKIIGHTSDEFRAKSENSIVGMYNQEKYYILRNTPLLYPKKPTNKYWHVYHFDLQTENWILDIELTDSKVRQVRKELFNYVDKVNPIWLQSMNALQQLQVANYRQDLLDITDQPNYPIDINWPIVPDFLK
jgi:hypothetical protein